MGPPKASVQTVMKSSAMVALWSPVENLELRFELDPLVLGSATERSSGQWSASEHTEPRFVHQPADEHRHRLVSSFLLLNKTGFSPIFDWAPLPISIVGR